MTFFASSVTLVAGTTTIMATLRTAGSQTVTATGSGGLIPPTGTTSGVSVTPGPATKLVVTAPATATAGTAVATPVVKAVDQFGNTATTDTDSVHVTSTDPFAVLPAHTALASGTKTFSVSFRTAGTQTITATDLSTAAGTPGPATSGNVTVAAATTAATKLTVTAPATATEWFAGQRDRGSQGHRQQLHQRLLRHGQDHEHDITATHPAGSTLVNGVGTFMVAFKTSGAQTVTATDAVNAVNAVNATITGISSTVTVAPGSTPATHLSVAAPATANTGTPVSVTVSARDANNVTTSAYTGTVHLTSTDPPAMLPADAALTNGSGVLMVTFKPSAPDRHRDRHRDHRHDRHLDTGHERHRGKAPEHHPRVGSNPQYLEALVTAATETPTGTVSFTVDGVGVGSSTLNANGVAFVAHALRAGQ